MLDINVRVKEVHNKIELSIQVEQPQVTDLFRYLLERALKDHFGFSCPKDEDSGPESSVNKAEKISRFRIDRKSALSKREIEILQKLSMGWSHSKIARHFKLTINTVKSHLQSVYLKLGVSNRLEAAVEYRKLFETINKISSEN